jgi:hypothetical protein
MRSPRLLLPLVVVLQIGVAASAARAEEISLSRYRLKTEATFLNQTVREQIDAAVLADFCQDDDGCAVLLVSDDTGARFAKEARLMLSLTLPGAWSTTENPPGVLLIDGNATPETVISFGGCTFSDVDDDGSDNTQVFSLTAQYNAISIKCLLTLMD